MEIKNQLKFVCVKCNKNFIASRRDAKFCSGTCKALHHNILKAMPKIVAPMVKTIEKQEVIIEKLENEVDTLESEVDTLESEILYYKKRHLEINKALKNTLFDHPIIYKQYSDKYLEIEKMLHEKYNIK